MIVLALWGAAVVAGCGTNEEDAAADGAAPGLAGDAHDRGNVPEGGPSTGVGSLCDVLTDAGPTSGIFNASALECPSFICLKPVVQTGATISTTGAFCSAPCEQDSDCTGAEADPNDPSDRRCQTGFVCGVPFVKGRLCCQKLCLCKDFLGPAGATVPIACRGDAGANCQQPEP